MSVKIRAAIAVGLLGGYYLLAVAIIGGLGALTAVLWLTNPGPVAAKASLFTIGAIVAVGGAFIAVLRAKPAPPDGVALREGEAPQLWALARQVAASVGTRAPDEIRLVAEVNAAVSEQAGLLGLRPGRRFLYVGTPLLMGMDVGALRAVLAHEFGHYSGHDTRLGGLTYLGYDTMAGTIGRLGRRNVLGWLFRCYFWLYRVVSLAVRRRQESDADQAMVRVAGTETAVRSLRSLPPLSAAWDFYLRRYVAWGWEFGYAPADITGSFPEILAGRAEELRELASELPEEKASRWDSHPPIAERVAAIARTPAVDGTEATDPRPATDLVPDLAEWCARLDTVTFRLQGQQVLPFPEYTAAAALTQHQQDADVLYRTAGRLSGVDGAGLSTVLDLLAADRLPELATAVTRCDWQDEEERQQGAAAVTGLLAAALAVAAARGDNARWRHSWSGPIEFVDAGGAPLDVDTIALTAVTQPGELPQLRARLVELGVREDDGQLVNTAASATNAEVVGALANVKVDGVAHDLVLLDAGFVFVPSPKSSDDGKQRLTLLVSSASPSQLAKDHRFLPYEEVVSARITKNVPLRIALTLHDGTTVAIHETWTGEQLGKSSDALRAVAERLAGSVG